jgi:hypothetical protein
LDNNNWEYKKSYRDDCIREDELADLVYLRSGDKRKAFGVITNRRANYFTLGSGECVDTTIAIPEHSEFDPQEEDDFADYTDSLQNYGSLSPAGGSDKLQMRNMKSNLYRINYYSPYNLSSPIGTGTAIGPTLNLNFPEMDTLDIILFTARRSNINFKSGFSDTVFSEETIQREVNNEKEDDVIVYPNPNEGQFVVLLEKPKDARVINIKNSLGQLVDSRKEISKENRYKLNHFNAGIYAVEVIYADKIIRKKMVIN